MKVLKILGGLILLVIAVFVIGGMMIGTEYETAKAVTIDASVEEIHALVGHLERWPEWTPFEKNDPSVKTTVGDKTTGIGASQSWTSDQGDGWLKFTECDAEKGVAYDMAFIMDDIELPSKAQISYEKKDNGVEVTWTMQGDLGEGIMNSWMTLVMSSAIGVMFEEGLTELKTMSEKGGQAKDSTDSTQEPQEDGP